MGKMMGKIEKARIEEQLRGAPFTKQSEIKRHQYSVSEIALLEQHIQDVSTIKGFQKIQSRENTNKVSNCTYFTLAETIRKVKSIRKKRDTANRRLLYLARSEIAQSTTEIKKKQAVPMVQPEADQAGPDQTLNSTSQSCCFHEDILQEVTVLRAN